MTTAPFLLTDEVLDTIRYVIRTHHLSLDGDVQAERIDRAIRDLRDRAADVVTARRASNDALAQAIAAAEARPLDFASQGAAANRARTEDRKMLVAIDRLGEVLP